jgi:hypothetical protein
MPEIVHGRYTSTGAKNICRCGNKHWVVTETDDAKWWWLCPACGALHPLDTWRLHGHFPKGMQKFAAPS